LILNGLALIVVSHFLGLQPENFSSYVTWIYLLGRTMCGFGSGLFLAKFIKEREQKINNLRLLSFCLFIFALSVYVGKFAETFLLLPVEFLFVSSIFLLSNVKNPSAHSRTAKISHVLGSSSFGVYVFHSLFFDIGNRFIGLKVPSVISFLIQISFVIFIAWAINKYVEPPIREKLSRFIGKTHN
jgi:peptidoglycan/LPS O-acetylase OafA/YrhL